jgi:hypothetical protein
VPTWPLEEAPALEQRLERSSAHVITIRDLDCSGLTCS